MTESKLTDDAQIDWLQHQWVLAGVVASAARFVAIPFVDMDSARKLSRRKAAD